MIHIRYPLATVLSHLFFVVILHKLSVFLSSTLSLSDNESARQIEFFPEAHDNKNNCKVFWNIINTFKIRTVISGISSSLTAHKKNFRSEIKRHLVNGTFSSQSTWLPSDLRPYSVYLQFVILVGSRVMFLFFYFIDYSIDNQFDAAG